MNYALDYIRRWRHTRGYGVHSPLAYTIVKECIRPDSRYGFYCDAYLDFEYHEDRKALHRARLIIRLLHLLRPRHIWIPNADKRIVAAIKQAMPSMRITTQRDCPKDTDFMILFNMADTPRLWKKMDSQKECGLLSFGHSTETPCDATLEIESKDYSILLKRNGMQRIKYEV